MSLLVLALVVVICLIIAIIAIREAPQSVPPTLRWVLIVLVCAIAIIVILNRAGLLS